MQIKDIVAEFAKLGLPLLGAALPIPGGEAIGTAVAAMIGAPSSAPEDILKTVQGNADALVKAKQFELTHQETILRITVDAEVRQVEAVNKTLQTEAMGGSFWQKNHHGFETSLFMVTMTGVYFVLPILKLPVPTIPEFAFMAMAAVLGVTAWQRGVANITAAKQQ